MFTNQRAISRGLEQAIKHSITNLWGPRALITGIIGIAAAPVAVWCGNKIRSFAFDANGQRKQDLKPWQERAIYISAIAIYTIGLLGSALATVASSLCSGAAAFLGSFIVAPCTFRVLLPLVVGCGAISVVGALGVLNIMQSVCQIRRFTSCERSEAWTHIQTIAMK